MEGKTFDILFCSVACLQPPPVDDHNQFSTLLAGEKDFRRSGCLVMSGRAGDLTRIVTFLIGRSKDGMNKFVEGGREGRGDR